MSRPRNLSIFTSPLAFACFCVLLACLWTALMLAPAFVIAALQQPRVVAASPEAR